MGLRSRTLACAATRARQTQTTTACPEHSSGLYRSHARVVGDPEVMRRNLSLRIIAESLIEECVAVKVCLESRVFGKFPTGGDGAGNLPITPFHGNSAPAPNGHLSE